MRRTDLDDFVEEQGPALGGLDFSASASRTWKRAWHRAEQLTFDQPFQNRCAVKLDERTIASWAVVVDRTRELCFACSTRPRNQKCHVERRVGLDLFEHSCECLAATGDAVQSQPRAKRLRRIVLLHLHTRDRLEARPDLSRHQLS